ncbi:conserved unknown protein [Ectocarpus siliculosus]|uniref:Ribonucleoside-diphosphate reductase n=1 Tax=Ectocarpus siliculosus TaxID=2880 RepID=D7FMA2_ECTSI|nr:conserved unknown protein [Ectocarpus siliculosus]|eukprot:CBJ29920.1 conserved unknown protein [Ectocarpus siliculosus]
MVRRRRATCAVVGMLASTSVVATGPPSAWTGYPQQPRGAPPQESDGARDASAAAARGWARSQSSRLREGAPRMEAEEESAPSSQPRNSASSSGGVGVVNNSGGGGGVDVAPRRMDEQGAGGGGAIAAEEDRNSSDRGGGKEERDEDGRLQQSPSSEEEAFLLEEGERGGAPSMHVVKRDGRREPVMFDKITARIRRLCWGLDERYIDPVLVAQKVVQGIYSGVTTWELDTLAAETCAYMNTEHPHYARLAARISVSNLQRATSPSFADTVEELHAYVDPKTGRQAGYISDEVHEIVMKNRDLIDAEVKHERDFSLDFFGFKTLERAYLLKLGDKVMERPQYMFMRIAIGIHGEDLEAAFETYHLMSEKWFIHASPTLFHAGTCQPQLSSCFLLTTKEDSIAGIYDTLKQWHSVGAGAGFVLAVVVSSSVCVGSISVRANLPTFLCSPRLKIDPVSCPCSHQPMFPLPLCTQPLKRDLFYGLWIPDLFMERVEQDGEWSLMCPSQCPGLSECWGKEFEELYTKYEREGKYMRKVRAQDLWFAILDAQTETGNPYMMYKDACNRKSNHKHLGTIQSSNLCTEIVEYTDPGEVAVCNLGSVVLPKFVSEDGKSFDHQRLFEVTKVFVRNLNKIIDVNWYPVEEAQHSNARHRPMGIGVQGLADAFIKMRMPFESEGARALNRDIFETMYFAAMTASCELAEKEGPYETFEGSPVSKGIFQFDMWGETPSDRWDWASLRTRVAKHGVRNSLLLAPMPTASTAQILGFNECIEPYTSNLYARRVKAGEFIVVNPHLFTDLMEMGLWSPSVRNQLMASGGSIASIAG